MTYRMPPEWAPHERTWMAWPGPNPTFGDAAELAGARAAWASVARAVRRFEPVTMVHGPGQGEGARALLGPDIDLVERPLDDAWMRDIGPTFVTDEAGGLAAVDWVFNGWGAQDWARWDHDRDIARQVAALAGAPVLSSTLVNEGGAIHVDGEGTVLLTDTVQLGAGRNPGRTRADIEAEIHARLGTRKAIWLPHGLTADYGTYGTQGHVDIVAAFARPGTVLVHTQRDPAHPDHARSLAYLEILRGETDAAGRPLEVVEVPAPTVLKDEHGDWVDYSYINHYLCNDGVVLCAFDDPNDEVAADILGGLFPRRTVVQVDARTIFANGGGIHCVTQQQPKVQRESQMAGGRKQAPPREDVLAAAMEMIAARGLEKLTMAALGREVGMSSGHLLYYFRTKDELLLRTLEWSEGRLGAERARLLAASGPARARLDAYVELYLPDGHRDPHWSLWLEVWNRSQNAAADSDARDRQAAIEGAWHRDLAALLAEGVSRGEFRAVDPDRCATRLRALLDGFAINVAIGLRGSGRADALGHVREFLAESLLADA